MAGSRAPGPWPPPEPKPRGKKLLITAVAVVVAVLAALGARIAMTSLLPADDGPATPQATPSLVAWWHALAAGDCLNLSGPALLSEDTTAMPEISCTKPHDAEVLVVFTLPGNGYPGDAAVAKLADDGCTTRVAKSFATAVRSGRYEIRYIRPTSRSWPYGIHSVVCYAVGHDGKLKKPIPR